MKNKRLALAFACAGVVLSVQLTFGSRIWEAIKHPWKTTTNIKDSLKNSVEMSKNLITQMQISIPKISADIKDIKSEVGDVRRARGRKDKISKGFEIIPNIMNVTASLGDIASKLSDLMNTMSTDIIARFNKSVAEKGIVASQKLQSLSKDIAYLKDRINKDLVLMLKQQLGLLSEGPVRMVKPAIAMP